MGRWVFLPIVSEKVQALNHPPVPLSVRGMFLKTQQKRLILERRKSFIEYMLSHRWFENQPQVM